MGRDRWGHLRDVSEPMKELLVMFPPMCRVIARRHLHVPSPGEVGRVVQYIDRAEDSTLLIQHESSILAGGDAMEGACECAPEWLMAVQYDGNKTDKWVMEDQEARGKELSPEQVYAFVLTEGVQPFYGGGVTPEAVIGGRRAFSAFGGQQARVKRVGQKKTGSGWSGGRLVSPDPGQRVWATRKSSMFRDIFGFAAAVCKAVGCVPHGVRRTAQGAEVQWKKGLSSLKGDEQNVVAAKLAEYNIDVDYDDPKSIRDALVQLRNVLRAKYTHSIETGQLGSQLQVAAAAIEELPEDSPLLDTYLDEGIDEISDFAPSYLDEMARLNGRRPRKPRKPRRSRRSRHNPLSPLQVEEAVAYAESRGAAPEPGELPRAFEALRRKEDPEQWELTRDKVDGLFPREFSGRGTWRPANRFGSLQQYNMVSRVGPLDPNSELVQQGRVGAMNADMVTTDQAARALMLAEAGLSLDEATRILNAQRGKKSSGFTMSPSSAICKLYRSRRLTAYRVPDQVLAATGSGKPQLLLMSPTTAYQPRVMTFRRGNHLDCDMVGSAPEDMPTLLGRALQSAMYWMVEKRRRHSVTDIWVGRVGQPDLFLALRRGEVVSLAKVADNLRRAEAGEPGYRVSIYDNVRQATSAMERDVADYLTAVRTQVGSDAARTREGAVRPSVMQAAPAAPAAEVPADPFGFGPEEEIMF